MTNQERQERLNVAYSEQQNLLNRLGASDYIEHKIVDAICTWAKSDKPTVAGLASSILALVGENGQYAGFPESKEAIRGDINAAQEEIARLNSIEVEEDVNDDAR